VKRLHAVSSSVFPESFWAFYKVVLILNAYNRRFLYKALPDFFFTDYHKKWAAAGPASMVDWTGPAFIGVLHITFLDRKNDPRPSAGPPEVSL
jgi:hypothetical protein